MTWLQHVRSSRCTGGNVIARDETTCRRQGTRHRPERVSCGTRRWPTGPYAQRRRCPVFDVTWSCAATELALCPGTGARYPVRDSVRRASRPGLSSTTTSRRRPSGRWRRWAMGAATTRDPCRYPVLGTAPTGRTRKGRAEDAPARAAHDHARMLVAMAEGQGPGRGQGLGNAVLKRRRANRAAPDAQMCGNNPDQLRPGERSASTSDRELRGRQGKGGSTSPVSPLVAAASRCGTLSSPAICRPVDACPAAADRRPRQSPPRHTPSRYKDTQWTPSTTHTGIGFPLRRHGALNTDQDPSACYLKRISRTGFNELLTACVPTTLVLKAVRLCAAGRCWSRDPTSGTGCFTPNMRSGPDGLRDQGGHLTAVRRHTSPRRCQKRAGTSSRS